MPVSSGGLHFRIFTDAFPARVIVHSCTLRNDFFKRLSGVTRWTSVAIFFARFHIIFKGRVAKRQTHFYHSASTFHVVRFSTPWHEAQRRGG
jgi:hypothetical protein